MRSRLLLSYLTITILVLIGLEVPLGISFAHSEHRRLEESVRQDAITLATRAEEDLESGPDAAGLAELRSLVSRYATENGDRVVVADADGRGLASNEPADIEPERDDVLEPPEIVRALGGHETSGTRYSNELGANLYYVAIPVESGNTVIGVVRASRSTGSVDTRVRNNWVLLASIGGAVLAIVLVVSLVVARSVTRPLADLGRAASRLGGGDLDARAPVPSGPTEVRLLAQEFNTTAGQLEALVNAQQSFVADASHQLRTPLAALRLRLENLESEVNPAGADDVDGARAEVERLSRLVDGLLTLARAERNPPAPVDVDVGAVLAGRREAWLAFAAERGVTLEADDASGVWAHATPERLEQVLDNVLNNALEVAPGGTAVRLSARAARDRVEVRVRDAGPGMTADERSRAFDRFWRTPSTPSDNGGFGLGLPIVRQLISADGGSVELVSPPDGGLEVVLTLRAGAEPTTVSPASGTAGPV
jgi:signal transduction histidine kinase